MKPLSKSFNPNSAEDVALLDELSLWASHFGHVMLENIPIQQNMTVLDVGFGLGFPLLEIAQRMGAQSQIYGIDPWETALEIARTKVERLSLSNVHLTLGDAVNMPFEAKFFNLIVSNVGIGNFQEAEKVVAECYRVLKKPGRICLTTNVQGTFPELYSVFRKTLKSLDLNEVVHKIEEHERHQSTDESLRELLENAGFSVLKVLRKSFAYRFIDGTAMLNHLLIHSRFLPVWRKIIPPEHEESVFSLLEIKLNQSAEWEGELKMTVPLIYVEAVK